MLPKNRLVGVVAGLAVVTVVGVGCLSNYVLHLANDHSEKDRKDLSRIVSSIEKVTVEDMMVEYTDKGSYETIEFDSIEDFVNSLQSLVRVEGADRFFQSKLYDSRSKDLIKLFETESGNVSVAVSEKGILEYCKFKGLSEEVAEKIMSLIEDSSYSCKEINDGFILEPSSVAS